MSETFDRLAMMLAGGGTRRDALKYLGGLLAGGLLAGLTGRARADHDDDDGGDDGDDNKAINAACKKFCSSCPKPHGVHGHCIEHCKKFLRKNPKGTLCGTCTAKNPFTGCVSGATCCPATTTTAAFCTNTSTDVNNCGACGKKCTTGTTPTCCAGACTDLAADNNNCGACGTKCAAGTTCKAGKCA